MVRKPSVLVLFSCYEEKRNGTLQVVLEQDRESSFEYLKEIVIYSAVQKF